ARPATFATAGNPARVSEPVSTVGFLPCDDGLLSGQKTKQPVRGHYPVALASREEGQAMASPAASLPRISLVVPSYNQACFLPEALDSIFRQQYPHLEVVVMDGGSTDGSVALIESYAPRLKYWQ